MTYQRNDTPTPLAEDITEEQMQTQEQPEDDFLSGVTACDLSGEGTCEACQ